jgi:hypothetical protein
LYLGKEEEVADDLFISTLEEEDCTWVKRRKWWMSASMDLFISILDGGTILASSAAMMPAHQTSDITHPTLLQIFLLSTHCNKS